MTLNFAWGSALTFPSGFAMPWQDQWWLFESGQELFLHLRYVFCSAILYARRSPLILIKYLATNFLIGLTCQPVQQLCVASRFLCLWLACWTRRRSCAPSPLSLWSLSWLKKSDCFHLFRKKPTYVAKRWLNPQLLLWNRTGGLSSCGR